MPRPARAGSPAARAVEALDPRSLIEYEPPSLPGQASPYSARSAKRAIVGFRVARASEALPPVPITYDVRNRTWRLLADYRYDDQGTRLTAKAGYAFDLSSIPRALWWLIAPNELSIVAPLFHDLLYEYRGRLPDSSFVSPYRTFTRAEADDLFLHLMTEEGVSWWRRHAAYSAVRAAGSLYWAT